MHNENAAPVAAPVAPSFPVEPEVAVPGPEATPAKAPRAKHARTPAEVAKRARNARRASAPVVAKAHAEALEEDAARKAAATPLAVVPPSLENAAPILRAETPADRKAAKALRAIAIGNGQGSLHGTISPETHAVLYGWSDSLTQLILDTVPNAKMPKVVLAVEALIGNVLGSYKLGRNGSGVGFAITLNVVHLGRAKADVAATLLHELLHAWEYVSPNENPGKNNHHSKRFCDVALSLGIPTNSQGHYLGITPDGAFAKWAEKNGCATKLATPATPDSPPVLRGTGPVVIVAPPKGKGSPYKLWTCGCQKIRSGKASLNVRCAEEGCGQLFVMVG